MSLSPTSTHGDKENPHVIGETGNVKTRPTATVNMQPGMLASRRHKRSRRPAKSAKVLSWVAKNMFVLIKRKMTWVQPEALHRTYREDAQEPVKNERITNSHHLFVIQYMSKSPAYDECASCMAPVVACRLDAANYKFRSLQPQLRFIKGPGLTKHLYSATACSGT